MDYLNELNESQCMAAEHINGPMMVIAGAGSGKTRVLTFRIAHLMQNGVDPFNILALTFTNKAAKEMKERISKIVGGSEAKNISMGTFHSVFAKILRFNAEKIGFTSNFTIYDTQDSRSLLKTIAKEMGLDEKVYKPNIVHARISSAKNNLISPLAYEANAEIVGEDRISRRPEIFRIYKEYDRRCFNASAMDFDDLLFKTNVLLRDFPEVLHFYQEKFKFILVDEYQDTNYAQYLIVKKLAALYENICVVGDDAQSIYSFRGANIQNILNFKKDYPDYKIFKLEQNYRSTKNIVEAANSIIARNQEQIKKNVWTANSDGAKINVVRCLTDNEEGRVITNKIYDLKHQTGADYKDFAILYRTNAQSRSFEESMRKLNMPYKIYGGLSFYQRKEIKDLIAYFRLAANPTDEEALKRTINYPKRGIGNTTIDAIQLAAQQYQVPMWNVISDFQSYAVGISSAAKNKISEFVTKLKGFSLQMENTPAYDLADQIARSSGILKTFYDDKTPEGVARYENIQELLAGIKEFSVAQEETSPDITATLSDFLVDVALLTDADQESDEDKNKITLMTIHASKGLEFPHVFIVGLEENLFPSQLALSSRSELEEERRLFYVALTRAEKTCTLSHVASRFRWGKTEIAEPSRFIDEINPLYIEHENRMEENRGFRSLTSYKRPSEFDRTSSRAETGFKMPPSRKLTKLDETQSTSSTSSNQGTTTPLKVGFNVQHERFGKGKVTALEGKSPDQKATVFFPRVGQKTLILRFAKLEVVD